MLLKLNIERPDKIRLLKEITGDSFSFSERLKHKIFGSPRYDILSVEPDILKDKQQGRICGNLEIRKKGLAIYFRFNHDEYVIASNFHQITIMKDENLIIQSNSHRITLKINNTKSHKVFLRQLIKKKAEFSEDSNILP